MTDEPALVAGSFRLGGLLGTGGSAAVFAADDLTSGLAVALKVLHPHLTERPIARDAFLAEARRAQLLSHPNIIAVVDVGIDDRPDPPIVWIALERAAGATLAEHVALHGPLSSEESIIVVGGVLDALEHAHARGLIHRDVSPSNIMVTRTGGRIQADGVRLLDFGLADASGRATLGSDLLLNVEADGSAGVMGNVDYMSPEQVRGRPVDERGDLYQAGAVLYFAVTGRRPFARTSGESTMRAHLEAPPPVPSVLRSRIPRALDRVVVRAMLKDPDDRFATAAEMRLALAAIAALDAADTAASVPLQRQEPVLNRTGVTRVLGRTVAARGGGRDAVTVVHGVKRDAGPAVARPRSGWGAGVLGVVAVLAIGGAVAFAASAQPTPVAPAPTATTSRPDAVESQAPEVAPTTVSAPASAQVPDLAMLTREEAIAALAAVGLVWGETTVADAAVPRDTVLRSVPAAGEWRRHGESVALVIASGSNVVPGVTDRGRDSATAALRAAGFGVVFVSRPAPPGVAGGTILGSEPGEGSRVVVGEMITVIEAASGGIGTPTPSPIVTPQPSAAP